MDMMKFTSLSKIIACSGSLFLLIGCGGKTSSSCSSSETSGSSVTLVGTPSTYNIGTTSLTCGTIGTDGSYVTGTFNAPGGSSSSNVEIELPTPLQVGTYTLGSGVNQAHINYTINGVVLSTETAGATGTVSVTATTATSMSGTFTASGMTDPTNTFSLSGVSGAFQLP